MVDVPSNQTKQNQTDLMQKMFSLLHGFKYSYLMIIIVWFQVIISI